jgi:polyisoprenoid-binding protein YceI
MRSLRLPISALACALLLTSLASRASGAGPAPRTFAIDPATSSAHFSISHIWVENVTGAVPIESGSVMLPADSVIPTRVEAILDATKIATGVADRDAALRSPDFFDTARYPTWTFVSTSIAPHGERAFEMKGNLTIHGITQPQKLSVTVAGTAAHPTFQATAQVDRHAFGMAITRLDPVIGASATVTVVVTLQ